ncbi:hypothetical protein H2248_003962 [Termitomyces sp. 'cryptogamus']|nr:hypothetical protein H2248_003962 [Termitomyces sp. 'cryptogamus']
MPVRYLFISWITTGRYRPIDKLETLCETSGHQLPDLHGPFSPSSEAFRAEPEAEEVTRIICAAALQLEATLMPPSISFYRLVTGYSLSAALRVCLESNVTEFLREAGPKGLHVDRLASKTGQDSKKLARFLRYLATYHCYREITPDVFTNTRISSVMDTLKSSQEILDNPDTKYNNTNGLDALASLQLDEIFKAAAWTWETLTDPKTMKSDDPKTAPISRAFGETLWELHARDEQRTRRFNLAMRGVQTFQPKEMILKAYEWDHLPENSIIVDVGGGVGNESLQLARAFPALDIVIQDLPPVIADAKKLWKDENSNARVTLEVHNFFEPQSKDREVSVFLLKYILHDWPDKYCVEILSHLRAAAGKNTKLVIVETLIPYACHHPSNDAECAIADNAQEAPKPLLANYGAVSGIPYNHDITMYLLLNSQERTSRHMEELLRSAGWLVKKFMPQHDRITFLQSIEAIPI